MRDFAPVEAERVHITCMNAFPHQRCSRLTLKFDGRKLVCSAGARKHRRAANFVSADSQCVVRIRKRWTIIADYTGHLDGHRRRQQRLLFCGSTRRMLAT